MLEFRIALTGDFLGIDGRPAYGGHGIAELDADPRIEFHYLMNQAPRANDPEYWNNLYSMRVTAAELAGVHGLIVLRPWIPGDAIEGAHDLVVIGRSGAGYDKIDIEACTQAGVAVFNVPRALDHSTASAALMFMLALAKRLPAQQQVVAAGSWHRQAEVMGSEINGRTLGIVGLGRSGQELARLVAPFRMRVLAFSPHADPSVAKSLGVELLDLPTLLRESDIVSLHARLRPDNHQLLGARELALIKPAAFLVNVARGELIDQPSLVELLQRRAIAGAGLDVFQTEPLPADDPLLKLDNVILTPHWSASTTDVWRATGEATARGMILASRGKVPPDLVNPAVTTHAEFRRKLAAFADHEM